MARLSSYTTHPGQIAAEACAFISYLIVRAINLRDEERTNIKNFLDESVDLYLKILIEAAAKVVPPSSQTTSTKKPKVSSKRAGSSKHAGAAPTAPAHPKLKKAKASKIAENGAVLDSDILDTVRTSSSVGISADVANVDDSDRMDLTDTIVSELQLEISEIDVTTIIDKASAVESMDTSEIAEAVPGTVDSGASENVETSETVGAGVSKISESVANLDDAPVAAESKLSESAEVEPKVSENVEVESKVVEKADVESRVSESADTESKVSESVDSSNNSEARGVEPATSGAVEQSSDHVDQSAVSYISHRLVVSDSTETSSNVDIANNGEASSQVKAPGSAETSGNADASSEGVPSSDVEGSSDVGDLSDAKASDIEGTSKNGSDEDDTDDQSGEDLSGDGLSSSEDFSHDEPVISSGLSEMIALLRSNEPSNSRGLYAVSTKFRVADVSLFAVSLSKSSHVVISHGTRLFV